MTTELSDEDARVAAGLAGTALALELVDWLRARHVFSNDDALAMMTGAIVGLEKLRKVQPHPAWRAAQNLLRLQAVRFGGPRPGAKLS